MPRYRIQLTSKALKQLEALPIGSQDLVRSKIDRLADNLAGDVKRLKSFSPAYWMRAGDFRILFDLEGDQIVIRIVGNRRDVYDR